MKCIRFTLFLLVFLFPQCQWNRNAAPSRCSLADEEIPESFLGIPDSLIKKLPILPDDYFMTESNIMKEEGYELDKKEVMEILQQCKGIIIPTSYDTFYLKRGEGSIRVFLAGKWPVSDNVDYFILKCITDEETVEVFIFSVIDNAINDSEWIAAIKMDSDSGPEIGYVFIGDDYDIDDDYVSGQIMSRRQGDTVYICFFDTQKKLQEEHKCFLTKDGEILFRRGE